MPVRPPRLRAFAPATRPACPTRLRGLPNWPPRPPAWVPPPSAPRLRAGPPGRTLGRDYFQRASAFEPRKIKLECSHCCLILCAGEWVARGTETFGGVGGGLRKPGRDTMEQRGVGSRRERPSDSVGDWGGRPSGTGWGEPGGKPRDSGSGQQDRCRGREAFGHVGDGARAGARPLGLMGLLTPTKGACHTPLLPASSLERNFYGGWIESPPTPGPKFLFKWSRRGVWAARSWIAIGQSVPRVAAWLAEALGSGSMTPQDWSWAPRPRLPHCRRSPGSRGGRAAGRRG